VVGFSIGASVALEMAASGDFTGPTVLLGISLSSADEPAFFHAIVGLGSVLGGLPTTMLAKGAASMVKKMPAPVERQAELRDDLRRNVPGHVRRSLREYRRCYAALNLMLNGCARQAPRPGSCTPRRAMVALPATSAACSKRVTRHIW
jgi:hypothetical protein